MCLKKWDVVYGRSLTIIEIVPIKCQLLPLPLKDVERGGCDNPIIKHLARPFIPCSLHDTNYNYTNGFYHDRSNALSFFMAEICQK